MCNTLPQRAMNYRITRGSIRVDGACPPVRSVRSARAHGTPIGQKSLSICDERSLGDKPMLPYSGPAPPTKTPQPAVAAETSVPSGRGARVVASGHAPRILIIEDEPLIALMIEEMIEELGYRVSGTAHSMAMASQEFAKHNYDAVLMDINMGGRYHAETADHLLGSGIPFAFVTGYDYLVEPRHVSVPVLQKPFEPADLRSLLKELAGPASPRFGQAD